MGTITTLPDDATRNGGARNPLPFQLRWRQAIADDPDVSQSAVLCAHALSLWMNGNGRCSPGIAEIARRMHCSERTAQRALAKLEKYLAIEPGKGTKTPTGWTNLYIARDPEGVSRGDTSDKQGVTETTARGDNGEARGDNDDTKGCHQCHPNSYNSEFAPYGNSKKENSN